MSGGDAASAGEADGSDDIDRRFSEIVSHLQNPPRPATPEAPSPPPPDAEPPPGPGPAGDDDSSDDHFIPPEPPPLPAGDLHFWAILAGLTLGPLVLLLSTVIPLLDSPLWSIVGVVMSVAGFVLLVLRSPGGDDDWGARV